MNPIPLRPWSCDTFAVTTPHTTFAGTLMGKNSDRPARESQPLRWHDSRRGNSQLRLANVEIDDVGETIPHLGSSPYWCWGHETGMNANGVAIGNEALFTRDLAATAAADRAGQAVTPGILGMELLRIGLERGHTARDAVTVMTDLVERHGQYGAGTAGKDRPAAAYDNSYLIADGHEVWVLQTSGRRWSPSRSAIRIGPCRTSRPSETTGTAVRLTCMSTPGSKGGTGLPNASTSPRLSSTRRCRCRCRMFACSAPGSCWPKRSTSERSGSKPHAEC